VRALRETAWRGKSGAKRVFTDAAHQVNVRHQRRSLLPLDEIGREIVDVLGRGDVAVVPLDRLGLTSSPAMERAGSAILADLVEEQRRDPIVAGLPRIRTATAVAELRAWATEPALLAIAQHHVGLPVTFQGVHARLERPNATQATSELWHRDREDRRMMKCFVHFDGVTADHGPFEYVLDRDLTPAVLRRIRAGVRAANRRGVMG